MTRPSTAELSEVTAADRNAVATEAGGVNAPQATHNGLPVRIARVHDEELWSQPPEDPRADVGDLDGVLKTLSTDAWTPYYDRDPAELAADDAKARLPVHYGPRARTIIRPLRSSPSTTGPPQSPYRNALDQALNGNYDYGLPIGIKSAVASTPAPEPAPPRPATPTVHETVTNALDAAVGRIRTPRNNTAEVDTTRPNSRIISYATSGNPVLGTTAATVSSRSKMLAVATGRDRIAAETTVQGLERILTAEQNTSTHQVAASIDYALAQTLPQVVQNARASVDAEAGPTGALTAAAQIIENKLVYKGAEPIMVYNLETGACVRLTGADMPEDGVYILEPGKYVVVAYNEPNPDKPMELVKVRKAIQEALHVPNPTGSYTKEWEQRAAQVRAGRATQVAARLQTLLHGDGGGMVATVIVEVNTPSSGLQHNLQQLRAKAIGLAAWAIHGGISQHADVHGQIGAYAKTRKTVLGRVAAHAVFAATSIPFLMGYSTRLTSGFEHLAHISLGDAAPDASLTAHDPAMHLVSNETTLSGDEAGDTHEYYTAEHGDTITGIVQDELERAAQKAGQDDEAVRNLLTDDVVHHMQHDGRLVQVGINDFLHTDDPNNKRSLYDHALLAQDSTYRIDGVREYARDVMADYIEDHLPHPAPEPPVEPAPEPVPPIQPSTESDVDVSTYTDLALAAGVVIDAGVLASVSTRIARDIAERRAMSGTSRRTLADAVHIGYSPTLPQAASLNSRHPSASNKALFDKLRTPIIPDPPIDDGSDHIAPEQPVPKQAATAKQLRTSRDARSALGDRLPQAAVITTPPTTTRPVRHRPQSHKHHPGKHRTDEHPAVQKVPSPAPGTEYIEPRGAYSPPAGSVMAPLPGSHQLIPTFQIPADKPASTTSPVAPPYYYLDHDDQPFEEVATEPLALASFGRVPSPYPRSTTATYTSRTSSRYAAPRTTGTPDLLRPSEATLHSTDADEDSESADPLAKLGWWAKRTGFGGGRNKEERIEVRRIAGIYRREKSRNKRERR